MTKNDELTASDLKDILSKKFVAGRCNIVAEQLQDFKMILAGPILQPGAARRFEKQQAEATDLVQATYRWQRNFADVIFTDEQMSALFS